MTQLYTEMPLKIEELAEGDEEFKSELTNAVYQGLKELKEKYTQGRDDKDMVVIQQIRHKLKPTLAMFEMDLLTDSLQAGKQILDTEGFTTEFETHFVDFLQKVEIAISEVGLLVK